jgi:hypothetical protein
LIARGYKVYGRLKEMYRTMRVFVGYNLIVGVFERQIKQDSLGGSVGGGRYT